ncbi:MAG: hypothetical protein IJS61_03740, partial [Firmicutes bacterium]|nr:hypothetical protein [Bacillota bacterium]
KKVIGTPIGWLLTIVKSAFASLKRRAERLFIGKNLIFAGGVIFHTPLFFRRYKYEGRKHKKNSILG